MEINLTTKKLDNVKTDAVFFLMFEDNKKLEGELENIDKALNGGVFDLIELQKYKAEESKFLIIPTLGKIKANYVAIVGLGKEKKFENDIIRRVASYIIRKAKELKLSDIIIDTNLQQFENYDEVVQAITEGLILGDYSFDKYFSKRMSIK